MESKAKLLQRSKKAEAEEKLQALRHDKNVKANAETAKLAKINLGATDFLKWQKNEEKQQKMNKRIQGFAINEQAGALKPAILKNKNSVPEHAAQVHDAEGLRDQLKDLLKEVKLLNEDSKQVAKNIYDGEQALVRAKAGLNVVLQERKLIVDKGEIQKERSPDDDLDPNKTDAILLDMDMEERNPLEDVVQKFAELGFDAVGAFDMLDDNGDEVLTLEEIKSGMAKQGIHLSPA